MVYYLKINEDSVATIHNLREWILVLGERGDSSVVVVCDNPSLLSKLVEYGLVLPGMRFICSERENEELCQIADAITNKRWRNAGFAHLTVFWDAIQHGYDAFWNIDADDTHFCLSHKMTAELLKVVEEDAKRNGIHAYSLDMHTTRTDGIHWSFGITYTDNSVDWLSEMKKMSATDDWQKVKGALPRDKGLVNIDMFFTYLKKSCKHLRVETFYPENTYFIHYSSDFLALCIYSGVYYWNEGKLYSPILSRVFEFEEFKDGQKISDGIQKIDLGIALSDSLKEFQNYIIHQHGDENLFKPVDKYSDIWRDVASALNQVSEE